MKKSKFTEEQIVTILKEQEQGLKVSEICRKHGIADQIILNDESNWIFIAGVAASYAQREHSW